MTCVYYVNNTMHLSNSRSVSIHTYMQYAIVGNIHSICNIYIYNDYIIYIQYNVFKLLDCIFIHYNIRNEICRGFNSSSM